MKIVNPNVEIVNQEPGYDGMIRHIEKCGRTCYKSADRITEDSAVKFVNMLLTSGHLSVLEHGAVYLQIPYKKDIEEFFRQNPYSRIRVIYEEGAMFVSTNLRVIKENGLDNLLEYMVECGPMHERRVTAKFSTQIAIGREFNRHRVNSPSEESTRYVNYSKDRFGNEISINMPSWLDGRVDGMGGFNAEDGIVSYANRIISEYLNKKYGREIHNKMSDIDYWMFANMAAEWSYMKLIECGWKAQQARTVLPLDTSTELVHTAFVNDWMHFFVLRCDKARAHPDAYLLASELERKMRELQII